MSYARHLEDPENYEQWFEDQLAQADFLRDCIRDNAYNEPSDSTNESEKEIE